MTKKELLNALKTLAESSDPETAHRNADEALLNYINDQEITDTYDLIDPKWYS